VFHVEQTVAGRDLVAADDLSDGRFRTSTTRTTVRAQRAFGEADAGRVDAHLAASAGDVVASRYGQPRMPAAAPWPSRRCLFHVEHITCGWRPRWCGGGNFGRSRLRGQPCRLLFTPSAALRSTWNSETGLVGIRLPGKGPARRSPITVLPPTVGLRALYRRIGGNSLHGASLSAEGPSCADRRCRTGPPPRLR
jgi:hypothetical protein